MLGWLPRSEEKELFAWLGKKEALALVGPRCVGKSTAALRLLEAWESKGGQGKRVNLEDPNTPADADHEYLEACVSGLKKGALVVLDEVQNALNWGRWVRKQVEEERFHFVVTGSSAALLSGDVTTILAGRAIQFSVLPLCYPDFAVWSHLGLKEYFTVGGYPECVKRPLDAAKLHETYFDLTILKDVAARHKIRDVRTLQSFATLLLTESTKKINLAKAARALKTSEPTLLDYRKALEDAFLIFTMPQYSPSFRNSEASPKKVFAWDLGLLESITKSKSPDYGAKFENAVAIELKRRGYSLSYYQGDGGEGECDFIAEKRGEKIAVQACSVDDAPEREAEGLVTALRKTKAGSGVVVTPSRKTSKQSKDFELVKSISLQGLLEGEKISGKTR